MTAKRTPDDIDSLAEQVTFNGLQVRINGEFEHRRLIEGWIVRGEIRVDEEGPVLATLKLEPADRESDARVTSKVLRSIPVAELLGEIRHRLLTLEHGRAFLYQRYGHDDVPPEPWPVQPQPKATTRQADARKQALLRRVAIAYLTEVKRGVGVYTRVTSRFRGRYSTDQMKALVRAARSDGWLSGATHGSRGADPGPRLLQDEEFMTRKEEQ